MSMYEILQNKCDLRTYVFNIEIYITFILVVNTFNFITLYNNLDYLIIIDN